MALRRFSFSRNPLRRLSDRIESGVLVAAVAALLVAVPLATQANEAAYQSGLRAAAEAVVTSARSEAVVLESSSSVRGPVTKPKVRVACPAPDSSPREGVRFGTKAGTRIPVWTGRDGSLTGAPPSLPDVRSTAIVVASRMPHDGLLGRPHCSWHGSCSASADGWKARLPPVRSQSLDPRVGSVALPDYVRELPESAR